MVTEFITYQKYIYQFGGGEQNQDWAKVLLIAALIWIIIISARICSY